MAERIGLVRDGAGTVWDAAPAARSEVIIQDVEGDLRYASDLSWTRASGIRAIHTTPIFDGGGRLLGAFSIFYDRPKPIDAPQRRRNGQHAEYLGGLLQSIKSNFPGAAGT
ncbi:MAG: GAF domain-containing protein [Bosea sp. (in: a-proteobacteria)]|uniref:GAF domain-containing protein n=1 Tax=Bosea sp. (in: a-proteobacteria) TaxID=1871050 RepID=UPI003F7B917B